MKPYAIPTMKEIGKLKHNGFNVVSTFSGAGGSCLGYRMAGYRVAWANEFILAAQKVYKMNHQNSFLNTHDIRDVSVSDILRESGLRVGKVDLFDGSPPCSAFSSAGIRTKGWGHEKNYSGKKQRVDDLFFEYIRLLNGLQPKVFVAENVDGLVHGKAKGYFKEILKGLKGAGYNVSARVLDSSMLGLPQRRKRLIFVGTRKDLNIQPVHPVPVKQRYSCASAFINVDAKYSPAPNDFKSRAQLEMWASTSVGGTNSIRNSNRKIDPHKPSPTISATVGLMHHSAPRWLTIPEIKRLQSFPDDFKLAGSFTAQWERVGRSVPPLMMRTIASTIEREILCKTM